MSLVHFIKNLSQLAKVPSNNRYVLGNPSADYDSFFGSIIYAFYLTTIFNIPYLPLIDSVAQDIPLRFEVNYILKKFDLTPNDFLYYTAPQLNSKENLNIQQIIDHHDFKHLQTDHYLIYPAGSTLTLLYYLYNPHLLPQPLISQFTKRLAITNPLQTYDTAIDQIIRYGVLMDCFGFDMAQKQRWTEYDLFAVKEIQKVITYPIGYNQLNQIKFNQQISLQLSCADHLRKDYKEFLYQIQNAQINQRYVAHYSVIFLNPQLFIQRYADRLMIEIQKKLHGKDQKYSIKGQAYILMFIFRKDGNLLREILYLCQDQEYNTKIQDIMKNLKMTKKEDIMVWKRWSDPSCTVSRKLFDKIMRSSL